MCHMVQWGATTNIPHNTFPFAPITFAAGNNNIDTDGYFSIGTSSSQLTISAGLGGLYRVSAQLAFVPTTTPGSSRWAQIWQNGSATTNVSSSLVAVNSNVYSTPCLTVFGYINFAAGDTTYLTEYQDSGASLSTANWTTFSIEKVIGI